MLQEKKSLQAICGEKNLSLPFFRKVFPIDYVMIIKLFPSNIHIHTNHSKESTSKKKVYPCESAQEGRVKYKKRESHSLND